MGFACKKYLRSICIFTHNWAEVFKCFAAVIVEDNVCSGLRHHLQEGVAAFLIYAAEKQLR